MFNFKYKKKFSKPYIIAEIGVNHEASLIKAKKLIKDAKEAGADAVKFQTYKANKLASKYSPYYWDIKKEKIKSQYELFKKFDKFNYREYLILFNYCKKLKIDFMSTPFDVTSVDYLDKFMPAFKIASADINNFPLIEKIATKKKPILLSTGASNLNEIEKTIKFLEKKKCTKIVIMHCILNYPTRNENANLLMINSLKEKFSRYPIGYSDHTLPDKNLSSLLIAYTLGARVIEKHFTDNKKKNGNDHYHSMDKNDLKNFRYELTKLEVKLGNYKKKVIKSEYIARKNARRSLVVNQDLKKGSILREHYIEVKRPGIGLSPENLYKVINKRLKKNIKKDQIIKRNHIF